MLLCYISSISVCIYTRLIHDYSMIEPWKHASIMLFHDSQNVYFWLRNVKLLEKTHAIWHAKQNIYLNKLKQMFVYGFSLR